MFARLELNKLYEDTETNRDDVCSCSESKAEMAQVPTVQENLIGPSTTRST